MGKGASEASGGGGGGVGAEVIDEGESAYRQRVEKVLQRLDKGFENVDPDLAESDFAQGTLVVIFRQAHKLIVSPQTPLRQIWAACRDRAWHFGFDPASGCWMDDRGRGIELFALVVDLAREYANVELVF